MSVFEKLKYIQLDVDPRMDDNASPMSSYWSMLRIPTLAISVLWHKSKYKSNINFKLFWEKNWICGFLCYSTCADFPIDVLIAKIGLILTKLRWFQLFGTSQNSISKFFEKKIKFLGFPAVVLVKTFLLMYQLLM